jgi:hypothetical protein
MKNATAQVVKFPSQNGNGRPGTPGYRWSPAQHRKFVATMRAKRKERLRARRELAERSKPVRKGKAAPRAPRALPVEDLVAARRLPGDRPIRDSKPATGRSGESLREQRSDAIVYLEAAAERLAHVSNAELLAALALRRLRGQIK